MMIDWYLDEDGLPIESRCGVIRYFIRIGEALETRLVWGDTEQEVREQARQYDIPDNIPIKTFTFINSTVYDNQILVQQSPDYLANLYAQNAVLKARMLYGNWNIDYDDFGIILNREYFPRYNLSEKMQIPGFFKETYFVIDGASKTKESNDYSVIGLAGRSNIDDKWYIIDWIREKLEEPDLEQLIIDKWHEWRSKLDNKIQFSPPRGIWIEDKSCGTGLLQRLPRKGIPCQPLKAVKDKYLRLNDGLMFIKNQFVMIPDSGNWVNKFFEELECFRKDGKHVKMNGESKEHDDQVDVLAYMISTQINTLSEVQALILPEERQNTVKKWYDM
jgi:predicted phage terminase large subunit-like protein